jgi:hypothetical protein
MKTSLADKYFSLYIRLRDADENGCAKCFTCGAYKPVKEMDCGHWIKRQHQVTRFSEMNCQVQCKRCNAFEQGRDSDFERNLIKKYSKDKLAALVVLSKLPFKRAQFELDEIAKYYKQKATELAKDKNLKLW